MLVHLLHSVVFLAAAWGVVLLGRAVADRLIASPRTRLQPSNAQFVRLVARLLSVFAVLTVVALWLSSLGVPVAGVLAGFGIGGIAVALGAQRTIENFFGALTLFADRPVRVEDLCRFGDQKGTVERIGLRSTSLRTSERSLLTIPNAESSRVQLENLALRDRLLFQTTLNLRLETTAEQLQRVLERLRQLLLEHDAVSDDPARVRLVAVGPHSLDIEIFAYVNSTDWNEFLAVREELFMEILQEVEQAGTALAPPAQTTYVRNAEQSHPPPDDSVAPKP